MKPDPPLEWPEDSPAPPTRRGHRSWFGAPSGMLIDTGYDDGPRTKGALLRAAVPVVIVAIILVLIGLILAATGPLPRIFPELS